MFECANVEMRELLPELAAGKLDAPTRARLEAHLATCAECASELETIRLVRGAFATAPDIDVARISAALPKAPAVAASPRSTVPVKRWVDWRIAAAVTMITVGGLSVAVTNRMRNSETSSVADDTSIAVSRIDSASPIAAAPRVDSGSPTLPNPVSAPSPNAREQLSFNGGVSDLDDASIQALLGALDEMDRAPVAPSAEPDHSPVLPVIKESER